MCFLMYSYELHQETVKKSQKNAALAFYHAFYDRNWVKIRENPLFSLKSRYLRNTFFETSLARKELQQFSNYWVVGLLGCWTIGTLSDNWHSGKWDSIPPFGHPLPMPPFFKNFHAKFVSRCYTQKGHVQRLQRPAKQQVCGNLNQWYLYKHVYYV